jgi:hypothetical protein
MTIVIPSVIHVPIEAVWYFGIAFSMWFCAMLGRLRADSKNLVLDAGICAGLCLLFPLVLPLILVTAFEEMDNY